MALLKCEGPGSLLRAGALKTKGFKKRQALKNPRIRLLAGTNQAIRRVEDADEPSEVQAPPIAVPAEVRHTATAIRVLPDRTRKDEIVPSPFLGDLVLVVEKPLGRMLAQIRAELSCTLLELATRDALLVVVEETHEFEIARLRDVRGMRGAFLFEFPAGLLAHIALEDRGWELTLEDTLKGSSNPLGIKRTPAFLIQLSQDILHPAVDLSILVAGDSILCRHDNLLSFISRQPGTPEASRRGYPFRTASSI